MESTGEESPFKYFVIEAHPVDDQWFKWVVEISRSDTSCRALFLIDDLEISSKQKWLLLLERARMVVRLKQSTLATMNHRAEN